jgi:predicted flap endonuclease-1-like 5' DNA nuclease
MPLILDFFLDRLNEYTGIVALMLSSFLIGYFSSFWLNKIKYESMIDRLKKKINSLKKKNEDFHKSEKIKNIETIFTEIKPKIIKVVKETQQEINETASPKRVALKARTSYVTYSKSKPKLNFEKFGYASKEIKDDLTRINGVGPYIEQKLNEIGIFTFDQISKFSNEDIRAVTQLIDFFPERIERDNWVGQANSLKVNL